MAEGIVSKEQILTLLNEDLKLEYSAALQYVQHYAVMEGAEFDDIRQHLLDHANEEISHAVKLSERIAYMGGTPVAVPDMGHIKLSADSMYMLALDLEGERLAIRRYKDRIEQAIGLREFGLAHVLQEILADEEEHEDDLVTSLGTGHAAPAEQVAEQFIRLASLAQERQRLRGT